MNSGIVGVSAAISRVKGQPVDLIAEQIRTALGEPLGYTQSDITFQGVGVEYRIIAEDPDNGFSPWVGDIDHFEWAAQDGLSLHTHVPPVSPEAVSTLSVRRCWISGRIIRRSTMISMECFLFFSSLISSSSSYKFPSTRART